jgi:hypothetical protein
MTVHHVGARPPAGFQDANYLAQGGDAASGAHARVQLPARLDGDGQPSGDCAPLRLFIPRCRLELQQFPRFRPVSTDGSGTVSSVTVSSSP